MRRVAVLFESAPGALVDEEHSRLLLFPACLSFAIAAAVRLARGRRAAAGTTSPAFQGTITNSDRAAGRHTEFYLQLWRAIDHAERFGTRHRLEVARGIPTASSKR